MPAIEAVYEQIRLMGRRYGAERIVLYGSRARGTNQPRSDIDLAVEGCPDFNGLEYDLQENLDSLLVVDVVNLDSLLSAGLKESIAREGRVLYEKA